jgi:NDP-hexose-3-ketoreductase
VANASVRFGILGCADIARRRVLPAIAALPGAEVAGIASRDRSRAEKLAAEYGCRAFAGYRALLAAGSCIDAVYVPLPAVLHAEWAQHALLAGKHVLAEKPLTTEASVTARLAGLARTRGLVLMENFMFLHHRQHAVVRDLVGNGVIGQLRSFTAAFTIPPRPATDIRYSAALGGGALLDVGVYPLRAAQFFLGHRLTVTWAGLRNDPAHGVDVAGAALLSSPGGVSARLTFGMEHAYRSCYEIAGSGGRIRVDRAFTPPASHRPSVRIEAGGGTRELDLEPDDQCLNTVRAFTRAVQAGTPGGWGDEAMALAALVDTVRKHSLTHS